jgi:hypothetical protein
MTAIGGGHEVEVPARSGSSLGRDQCSVKAERSHSSTSVTNSAVVVSGHSRIDQAIDRFIAKTGYSPVDDTKH